MFLSFLSLLIPSDCPPSLLIFSECPSEGVTLEAFIAFCSCFVVISAACGLLRSEVPISSAVTGHLPGLLDSAPMCVTHSVTCFRSQLELPFTKLSLKKYLF